MSDKKISQLTALAQGDVVVGSDALPILDASAPETKKITVSALVGAGAAAGLTSVDINSGSIDGTTIGANSAAAGTFTTLGATTGNITTVNATTVDTTNIEVTSLKAKDGTAAGSIADSTGVVTLASSVLTTTDINGGTIDGATIGGSSAAAASVTTLTTSSTVTHNGGTANGVAYLNGSKVLTTGSALTFDGTNLGVGVTLSAWKSGARAIQSGANGYLSLWEQTNGSTNLGFGVYESASNTFAYRTTGDAPALYSQLSGQHIWSNAASGTANATFSFTEQMRLTSTGLGIGTSSPGYPLQVRRAGGAGSLGVSVDSVGAISRAVQYYAIGDTTSATTGHVWYYRPATATDTVGMVLNGDGLVGIGTSSPAFKLHVSGSSSQFTLISTTDTTSTTGVLFGDSASNTVGRIEYVHSDDGMRFYTSGTAKATLDSSGNLGLGVTPSAWSTLKAFEFGTGSKNGSLYSYDGDLGLNANVYYKSGTGLSYISNGYATQYRQLNGQHFWQTAPSGTAGNAISFTQAMTLDASGNLGVGTTSPAARLHVVGSQFRQNDVTNSYGYVINTASGTTLLETLFGGSSFGIRTGAGSTDYINIDSSGNTTAGAGTLATNATSGFLYVPTCAGTPTGTPTAKTGYAPIVVNTTNNKLYFYSGGAWRDAGP